MESPVSERIRILIDAREKGNKAAFGRAIGVTSQSVADLLDAKGGPSFMTLQKIAKAYSDLSLEWLVTGEGEMLKGQQSETTGLHSGAATIERATELASNGLLREIIDTQKETITDLRGMVATLKEELGKFGSSLEAALTGSRPNRPLVGEMQPA
jgi:hypothetical protein